MLKLTWPAAIPVLASGLAIAGAFGSACAQAPVRISVYFDWNEFEISSASMAVVDEAIQAAKVCNLPGVRIVGHDDTSLPALTAQELSDQRAYSVRKAMIDRGGLDPGDLTTEGRGDREPWLPTPDNIREPLNRRVEIDIICR